MFSSMQRHWFRVCLGFGGFGATLASSSYFVLARYAPTYTGQDSVTIKPASRDRAAVAFSARFQPYTLGEIIPITHDVALFRFLFDDAETEFSLRPCSTLQSMFRTGSSAAEQTMRFYTPVTPNGTKGYFDIIVKRKPNGSMTSHLFGMHIGDRLLFRSIAYKLRYEANKFDHIGMICGGTGLTPMLQVIRVVLNDKSDTTRISLLCCNQTENHILLKGLLEKLQRENADRFRVFYTVDCPAEASTWKGYVGYVTPKMIQDTMPPPSNKNLILLCGPDNLLHHVAGISTELLSTMSSGKAIQPVAIDLPNLTRLGGMLADLGYTDENVYRF